MITDASNRNKDLATGTCQLLASDLLKRGLVPIPEAAEALGIDPKRLRGYIYRNDHLDPFGDLAADQVYGWSLGRLAARAADTDSLAP